MPVVNEIEQLVIDREEQFRQKIGVADLSHTFEKFALLPGTEIAFRAFKTIATSKDAKPLLMCYGGVGNGKTHLIEASVIALNHRGVFCRYYTWARIINTIKLAMSQSSEVDPQTVISRFCLSNSLAVDDVGMAGSNTKYSMERLEEIVCERYERKLLTIMTTNLNLDELPERVVSRFSDQDRAVMVLNQGGDYRRTK